MATWRSDFTREESVGHKTKNPSQPDGENGGYTSLPVPQVVKVAPAEQMKNASQYRMDVGHPSSA
jgi:hypothetical protein